MFNADEVDIQYGYYMTIGTLVLFQSIKLTITNFKEKIPKSMNADFYAFRNILISWIHGTVSGLWSVLRYCIGFVLFDGIITINKFKNNQIRRVSILHLKQGM